MASVTVTMATLLAALALTSAAYAQRPSRRSVGTADRWQVDTTHSEMTDEPTVNLRLAAISPAPATILDVRPSMLVRCRERELDVYIATGSVLDEVDNENTPVRIRWGTLPAEETVWGRSTDYSAAFAPDPRAFLTQLLRNPDLRFEVHPYDAVPVVITFDARGLQRHMALLNRACPEEEKEALASKQIDLAPSTQQVFLESVVEERPELLNRPRLQYPDLLRQAGVQGRVLVSAIIDTLGRAEAASVKVVQSPNAGFDEPAKNVVLGALFRPARVHGRAVRVLVNLPIDFTIRR